MNITENANKLQEWQQVYESLMQSRITLARMRKSAQLEFRFSAPHERDDCRRELLAIEGSQLKTEMDIKCISAQMEAIKKALNKS